MQLTPSQRAQLGARIDGALLRHAADPQGLLPASIVALRSDLHGSVIACIESMLADADEAAFARRVASVTQPTLHKRHQA